MKKLFDKIIFVFLLLGCVGSKKNFYLPFSKNQESKLIQSWNGPYGHTGHLQYAYDFIMPIGTPVLAAHAGRVVKVEEQYEDNNKTPGKENFVIIDNGNKTYSRYYHLTKNGVLVQVGDKVKINDTIALSGNTGASAGPHLHFDVTKGCYDWGCQTIAFRFKNTSENPLTAGKTYKPLKR
jgi:murein DD-endopeptidase MepM/ murein hydrolase activator NlpD